MGKKNIKPQQQQPVIRQTTAKAVSGLTEENLTQNHDSAQGAIPAFCMCGVCVKNTSGSFDGDDAE